MRTLTNLDLRLIRIFRAIAECQGLSNAELVLNLSQSRISAGLAELEARLGVRLCHRGRAGFALTEAGATVYEASHDLFEAADRFCNRAGIVSTNLQRVLRLGTVDAVATNRDMWLARALRRLRETIPTLIIDFLTASPSDLEKQVTMGSRDVVIIPAFHKKTGLAYKKILDEKHALYCGKGHYLFGKDDTDIGQEDIDNASFVARGYLHKYDLQRVGHGNAEANVETMEAQLVLIQSGEYIGFLPAHYAEPWVVRGTLRCMMDRQLSYNSPIYAVTQARAADNPLLRHFLSHITETQGRIPKTRKVSEVRAI